MVGCVMIDSVEERKPASLASWEKADSTKGGGDVYIHMVAVVVGGQQGVHIAQGKGIDHAGYIAQVRLDLLAADEINNFIEELAPSGVAVLLAGIDRTVSGTAALAGAVCCTTIVSHGITLSRFEIPAFLLTLATLVKSSLELTSAVPWIILFLTTVLLLLHMKKWHFRRKNNSNDQP